MIQLFKSHINENFPFLNNSKLLIAISGGIDSVVLTHLLHQLNYNFSLAHCNFKLRNEESDLDEEFVAKLGKKLTIPVFSIQFETTKYAKENKLSTQLAARELRYNWFNQLATEHNFIYILTAHHADDNLETFLINLTRGSGLDGLTGIPPINKNIVRPLLKFTRKQLKEFALTNNISWREDNSNTDTKYTRNKIRHQVIPILKELNPQLLKTHNNTIEFLNQSQQIVTDATKQVSKEILQKKNNLIKINIDKLNALSNPKAYLYQLLKEYNFTEWKDVDRLIHAQSGKKIITKSHTLLKDRDYLLLSSNNPNLSKNKEFIIRKDCFQITNPISLSFKNSSSSRNININCIFVDNFLLNYPLILRRWRAGDYFFPTGMTGKKKVSKYFKDEKLSLFEKNNTWLLCTNSDEIIWIVGKRQDRRFLPTNKTKEILKITN